MRGAVFEEALGLFRGGTRVGGKRGTVCRKEWGVCKGARVGLVCWVVCGLGGVGKGSSCEGGVL